MPLNTQLADATVNIQANALATLCNGGLIRVYNGTQPATANTALSGNTLGVTLTFGNPAFPAAVGGLLTANAITPGTAVADITPTFARIFKSDGTTVIMDVSAGATGANLLLGAFTTGTLVGATSFTHDVLNSRSGL